MNAHKQHYVSDAEAAAIVARSARPHESIPEDTLALLATRAALLDGLDEAIAELVALSGWYDSTVCKLRALASSIRGGS